MIAATGRIERGRGLSRLPREEWVVHAACRGADPEDWFLNGHERADGHGRCKPRCRLCAALATCGRCPVNDQCLEAEMDIEDGYSSTYRYGVWGGLTATRRANLAMVRSRRTCAPPDAVAVVIAGLKGGLTLAQIRDRTGVDWNTYHQQRSAAATAGAGS